MEIMRVSYINDIYVDMYAQQACNRGGRVMLEDGTRQYSSVYCFGGKGLFEAKKPKVWVYGRTYAGKNYKYKDCCVYNNVVGYPWEAEKGLPLKHLEVELIQ
jgi:hypothetical protein